MRRHVLVLSGFICIAALLGGCASENRSAASTPSRAPARSGPPRFYSGDSLGIKILKSAPGIVRAPKADSTETAEVTTQ